MKILAHPTMCLQFTKILPLQVLHFPLKYGKRVSKNTVSLHRSPSTTGARQKWGVHTHAQPHVHATWHLKNLTYFNF